MIHRLPSSSWEHQQHILGTFIESGGSEDGCGGDSPLLRDPRTACLSLPEPGVSPEPPLPLRAPAAAARIKRRLCRALMLPGGEGALTAECCFYTRFISAVNSGTEPLSEHALNGNERRRARLHLPKALQTSSAPPASPPAPQGQRGSARREGSEAQRSWAGFVMGLGEPGFKKEI